MATSYGARVYIVHEHRAISCTSFRRRTKAKPSGDRAEFVRKSCIHRAIVIRSPCGFRMEAAQRWYGDCAILGIRVPKVYKFTFLLVFSVEMAPKTKGGKEKRSKKENF